MLFAKTLQLFGCSWRQSAKIWIHYPVMILSITPWDHGCWANGWLSFSLLFLIFSIYLASINNCPGGPDSRNNLDTARNISQGNGFSTNIVQPLFVEQTLPSPETIRPPGVAFLAGAIFRIFGISLGMQVLLNAITILASAWLLRATVRLFRKDWFANLAGILIILSCSYDLISLGNNNFLVLFTIGLLYICAVYMKRNISIFHTW